MANNRESKPGRQELSSNEEEEKTLSPTLKATEESMDRMQKQKKLDLLDKMVGDIQDLRQSLDFHIAMVEVLKEDITVLQVEVKELKAQTEQPQRDKRYRMKFWTYSAEECGKTS